MPEEQNIPEENSKAQIPNINEESVNENIAQEQTIEATEPQTTNYQLQTENTEVHHHPPTCTTASNIGKNIFLGFS